MHLAFFQYHDHFGDPELKTLFDMAGLGGQMSNLNEEDMRGECCCSGGVAH